MQEYPKIQTIFKRDMSVKGAPVLVGQYSQPEFEYLANNRWQWTEKVDGTNVRVEWKPSGADEVSFGGRTDNAQMPTFLFSRLQELFPDEKKFLQKFDADAEVVLYGEGYGARIQKGGGNYIKDGVDFVLFDVQVGDWWLQRGDVEDVANHFGLKVVPVVGQGTLLEAVEMVRGGFRSTWGDFLAEGLVLRPKTELRTRSGHRIITKIKYRDFIHEPAIKRSERGPGKELRQYIADGFEDAARVPIDRV